MANRPTTKKSAKKRSNKTTSSRKTKRKVTAKEYNSIVSDANLASILLMESNFKLDTEYFSHKESAKFEYVDELVNHVYGANVGVASGEFKWTITVKKGNKNLAKLQATYLVLYDNLEDKNEAAVRLFVERVAKFACYPYFRSHVSNMSWASNAALPLLPVISNMD